MLLLLPLASALFDGSQTCGDITCSADESCCRDSPGSDTGTECCVDVSTYCVGTRDVALGATGAAGDSIRTVSECSLAPEENNQV